MKGREESTRLLILIPTLEIGGAERQMTLLLRGLDASQYSLALVCCRLEGPLVADVPSHVRVYDLGKRTRWDFPLLLVRLRRILNEFHPEFIIASMEYAAALAWLANRFRVPRSRIIARKEVMPSQARLGEPFRRSKRILDQMVDRQVDMIIAPSRGILAELAGAVERAGIPLVKIPNVVDLERISPPPPEALGVSSRNVVVMGRFVSWKRFDLAIEALAYLPPGSAELHLIGDGPERKSLELLARDLGVADRAHFYGYLPNPFSVLRHACIGVLPSQFEPFGNVIIEMFAAGLPVVAFDVDYGPREIIRDGENGFLVQELDAKDLAAALSRLLGDSELRKSMGIRARQEAERSYALGTAVVGYEKCFAALRRRKVEMREVTA